MLLDKASHLCYNKRDFLDKYHWIGKGIIMKIFIGVSNFGKIKKAEIDVSNFVVFTGKNNSGKSSMLQLLYGLLQRLPKLEILIDDYEIDENTELELKREKKWFLNYEKKVNLYLQENKEQIVESIFHRSIPVEDIYIKIVDINEKITIQFNKRAELETKINNNLNTDDSLISNKRIQLYIEEQNSKTDEVLYRSKVSFSASQSREFVKLYVERDVAGLIWNLFMGKKELLFLPASKAGIQLLYKSLLNGKENKKPAARTSGSKDKIQEIESGISLPVWDFLQFLLNYTTNNKTTRDNKKLTDFIEKYFLNGRLQQKEEETVYIPDNTDQSIPIGLASPVVNELAPMTKALTGTADYQYLFYDTVENCLDLEMQRQMARLLIRLNNSGKRLIVTTYSETMLSELSQLIQISLDKYTKSDIKENQKEKLDKLNLTKEDLLDSKNIHVYQFSIQSDGMSAVDELNF